MFRGVRVGWARCSVIAWRLVGVAAAASVGQLWLILNSASSRQHERQGVPHGQQHWREQLRWRRERQRRLCCSSGSTRAAEAARTTVGLPGGLCSLQG